MIKNFRNLMALLVAVIIFPGIWIMQGLGLINVAGEIIGATIAGETLILQFFFRKRETIEEN